MNIRYPLFFLLTVAMVLGLATGCGKKKSKGVAEVVVPKVVVDVEGVPPAISKVLEDTLRASGVGVLRQGDHQVAAIKNELLNVGDYLKLPVNGTNYYLHVAEITDDRILMNAALKQ
jgi:hypothetical protein